MQRLPLQPQDGFYLLRIHVLAALRPVPGQRCQPIPARAPPIFFLFHMAVLFFNCCFTVVLLFYCFRKSHLGVQISQQAAARAVLMEPELLSRMGHKSPQQSIVSVTAGMMQQALFS